ncbi:O antigen biosynthesis rhamnosyltransferase RfbN [Olivibacter ginsenosidimutans]|uniref:O antigen biosynthesis rhamnosyltransferase RfbN n=1 Tax=Olivibacter ginsenosidimutans TaxID=1176537 RepID=A0ABP9AE53_9SPHI
MKTVLYIPTFNAGKRWSEVIKAINEQLVAPHQKVIIDSGSNDGTLTLPELSTFTIMAIDQADFDHGGTRQLAVERFPDADLYIFLTQDAILADRRALANLIAVFEEHPTVGVAYGRQLPHKGAKALEAHARLFNYPAHAQFRNLKNAQQYGIKAISCSNSFAAYRREAFEEAGGFPSGTILGEDVITAGKIVLNGWQLAYVAEAKVYHSHSYTVSDEFKRYFDIGVFHAMNPWIFENFGHAESEGWKYVKSELRYVIRHQPTALPKVLFSLGAKWLGYKLGLHYKRIPLSWRRSFSMVKGFWARKA